MKEPLDSDRVNYLVWRYLVESGYRETAVRLQKEWNLEDPQQLPYATHVTNYALISALNKGLLYNATERELDRTGRDANVPVKGIFGPLTIQKKAVVATAAAPPPPAAGEEDLENARKRQNEDEQLQTQNGPAKRPRLSNGYENGSLDVAPPKSPMAMDIDEEPQNGNAYPSPEQLPSPVIATNGPERGTQMDKVVDLTVHTTFLDLSSDDSSSSSASKNTVLLQCEFHPSDPTLLAAAGTDALARMWTIARATPDGDADGDMQMDRDHVSPPYSNLLEDSASSNTTATLISWAPNGTCIAIASEPAGSDAARVEVWHTDNTSLAKFESFCAPVISLLWNPASTLLLTLSPTPATAPHPQGTLVKVMSIQTQESVEFTLPHHDLEEQILEAVWTGNEEFVLCGGDLLQAYAFIGGVITPTKKFETREDHGLTKVTFDIYSKLLATASETGTIDAGEPRSLNAHQGGITALIWQPITGAALDDESERLLASAGEDGAISIWNNSSETKYRSSMTMGSGVVGLAFTPDGAFIAGATNAKTLIWKVDDVKIPRAEWKRGHEQGWQTPHSQESLEPEDQHSLCWSADGQTLAYSVNGLLALIKFRT